MKKILASFAICFGIVYGASASAADIGYGLDLGADLDVNYTTSTDAWATGADAWAYKLTPAMSYSLPWGIGLSADTSIMIDDPEFTGINWGVSMMAIDNIEVYGKIKSDADHGFGDVTMGITLSF